MLEQHIEFNGESNMPINTSEVTELIGNTKRLQKIKQSMGSLRYYSTSEPRMNIPKGSDNWENIGTAVGMAGLEAELVFRAILQDPDERELAAIKQLLFLGKLRHTAPSLEYGKRVRSAQEYYDTEVTRYADAVAKLKALELELEEVQRESQFTDMMAAWARLMDETRAYVESHDNVVSNFKGLDRAFFELIKNNSKYVRVETSETDGVERAVVVWDKIRDSLNLEHVHTILRKWATILEQTNNP